MSIASPSLDACSFQRNEHVQALLAQQRFIRVHKNFIGQVCDVIS